MASVSAFYMFVTVILFHSHTHKHTHRYTLSDRAAALEEHYWHDIYDAVSLSGPVQHPSLFISVTFCLVLSCSRKDKSQMNSLCFLNCLSLGSNKIKWRAN